MWKDACAKLEEERMKAEHPGFAIPIADYLIKASHNSKSEELSIAIIKSEKKLNSCVNYIIKKALKKSTSFVAVPDAEVFDWVLEYYLTEFIPEEAISNSLQNKYDGQFPGITGTVEKVADENMLGLEDDLE